jgi:hypothetical protein
MGTMTNKFKDVVPFYIIHKSDDGKITVDIDPILVVEFWEKLGYRKLRTGVNYNIVKIDRGSIVKLVKDIELREELRDYTKLNKAREVQKLIYSKDFVVKKIYENLETIEISFRYGDATTALFFYLNGIVSVTHNGIKITNYEEYDGYLWEGQINQRNIRGFEYINAEFKTFLLRICNDNQDRCESLLSILGYLLHSYKDPTVSKAIILMDLEIDPDDTAANGGTGKSLIGQALSKIVSVAFFNGKNVRTEDKFFFSGVKPENKIMFFDDVTKFFDFESFYSMITGDMPVERKYKDPIVIDYQDSPKLLISSNYIIKGSGGNAENRRKIEFEISSYFKDVKTPIEEFGHRLFDDWEEEEWLRFDNLMIKATQLFLVKGIIEPKSINAKKNRLTSDTSTEFIEFMDDIIKNPTKYQGEIREINANFNKAILFKMFLSSNPSHTNKLSPIKFKKWIDSYCAYNNIKTKHHKSNGGIYVALYNIIKASEDDNISEIKIEE